MSFTLRDWFSMKDGRDSFRPRLPHDRDLVFCHDKILHDDVLMSIERSFATNEPIKMLIYGDWGVGKTHLTHHICWWLDQNKTDYPAHPLLIEIGDITKKSRFDEVIRPFMDTLGVHYLVELVSDYRGYKPNVAEGLKAAAVSSHIAEAFAKFLLSSPGQTPNQLVLAAFEYLKGRQPGAAGTSAGLAVQLDQSRDFYDVLLALGEMHQVVHGHRLLFIADEAAKLQAVEADEACQSHWVNVSKLIFDDANDKFGFIYTISAVRTNQLPLALFEPQIRNRLGSNAFELKSLAPNDVSDYLSKLVNAFIDRTTVESLVSSGEIAEADYDWDAYPFTVAARTRFQDHYDRNQADSKPRDISRRLDELAFIAGKQGKRLIDDDCLARMQM